jgi:hypothetical protein
VVTLSKRFLTRLGVGIGIGIAAIVVVWAVVLPSVVHGRAERAIADRVGMDAQVGRAWVGLGSATLDAVELTGTHGGVRVHLGTVKASAGWGALLTGRLSVDRVEAREVRVEVDLDAEGAEASLASVREALGGGAGGDGGEARASQEGAGRTVDVRGLQVDVRGGGEPRLLVRDGSIRLEGTDVRVEAAHLQARSGGGHEAELTEATVGVVRGGEGWRLRRLTASRGQVSLQQFAPADSAEDMGDEADTEEEAGDDDDVRAGSSSGWAERFGAAFARIHPEVHVRLDDLAVRSRAPGGEETILTDLGIRLDGEEGGVFRSSGSGRAAAEGDLAWEVMIRPGEARAEGTLRFRKLPLALAAPLLPGFPWHAPERAHLEGELEIEAADPARMEVRGRVALANAALMSPRIAPEPIHDIGIAVEGEGHWIPQQRRLVLETASIRSGPAAMHAEGTFQWTGGHYLVAATAILPPTRCGDAVAAVPADLLGEVAGFSWEGEMAGKLVVHVDSTNLDDTKLDIRLANSCRFMNVPAVADLRRFRDIFVHEVQEPDGTVFEMSTGPGTHNWQPIRSVSPFLVHAVLAHEDASFFRHAGFAPWAIEEALKRNLKSGRYVVGASTITMQLAKNLFLRREKNLARKVQEVLLTWWLESALEKKEILELYLNVIEYGPSVYGIRNAALHYFGRAPSELSAAEGAYLATILPNPKRHADEHTSGTLRESTAAKMKRLLKHMSAKRRIDEEAFEHARAEVGRFRFQRPGEPPPPPVEAPGHAGPLPAGVADEAEGSGWSGWDDVFEGRELRGVAPDDPYRDLPEVDPDAMLWD